MQPASNLDRPKSPRIIGLKEVILRTHSSRTSVYRMMGLGLFPAQATKLNRSRTAGWFENDIDAWIEERRPRKAWADRSQVAASQPPDSSENGRTARSVPDLSIHAVDRQKTQVPAARESNLIPTGLIFLGRVVYLHQPTKQLLLDIGKLDSLSELGVLLEGRAAPKAK